MTNFDDFETNMIRFAPREFIDFLMNERYIKNEMRCTKCNTSMSLAKYEKSVEKYAWRCYANQCPSKKIT